jgi:hypothetical protein
LSKKYFEKQPQPDFSNRKKKKVHLQGNIFQNFYWSIIFAPLFLTENKNENEKD